MIDQELREQIRVGVLGATDTNMTVDQAVDYIVFELEKLGYRKVSGKPPPVLSVAIMQTIAANMDDQGDSRYTHKEMRHLLQCQRAAVIAFYTGQKPFGLRRERSVER